MNKLLDNYNDLVPKRYTTVREVYDFLVDTFPTHINDMKLSFASGALFNWILIHYKDSLIGRVNGRKGLRPGDRNEIQEEMENIK